MTLQKDKFWDGGGATGEVDLDPARYHSPASEILPLSQRSVASILPPGTWGASGTIIRRSTEGGAPIGHDPHAVVRRVNVDPDIQGQGFVIDMTQLPRDALQRVVSEYGVKQAVDVKERRFRAATALRNFAVSDQPDPVPESQAIVNRDPPVNMPGAYVVPPASQGGGQLPMPEQQLPPANASQGVELVQPPGRIDPGAAPAFAQPPPMSMVTPEMPVPVPPMPTHWADPGAQPMQPVQPVPAAQAAQLPPVAGPALQAPVGSLFDTQSQTVTPAMPAMLASSNGAVGPPTCKVTLEMQGNPFRQEAFYHEVIREGAALVLVFDRRAVGFPRVFPQVSEQDLAVHIEGKPVIYVTQSTGIQFPFRDYDMHVLLIKAEHPRPE